MKKKIPKEVNALTAQTFGGPWSHRKLASVEKYLRFYTQALSTHYKLIYIDAFAGSGKFQHLERTQTNDLFDKKANLSLHDGSALRALSVQPPFEKIICIEKDASNISELKSLIVQSGHSNTQVCHGDANEFLKVICRTEDWSDQKGVIFLDPFGLNVEWITLQEIANTRSLDVWFLFSLNGLLRNLPNDGNKLDDGKRRAVTRILGTEEWYSAFYETVLPASDFLFASQDIEQTRRVVSVDQIESYVSARLRKIFPHVEPPKRLLTENNAPLFSLFFAVSNPSGPAIKLASKVAKHILK